MLLLLLYYDDDYYKYFDYYRYDDDCDSDYDCAYDEDVQQHPPRLLQRLAASPLALHLTLLLFPEPRNKPNAPSVSRSPKPKLQLRRVCSSWPSSIDLHGGSRVWGHLYRLLLLLLDMVFLSSLRRSWLVVSGDHGGGAAADSSGAAATKDDD